MSALFTPNAFGDLTAAQLAQLLPIKAIRGANSTPVNNSTVLVNDTALFVPVAANATYKFEMEIRYSTNTTANLKTAWTFPAGLIMHFDIIGMAAGASVLNIFPWDQGSPFAISGNATAARFAGKITVVGTPGTLQFQWAQNTANASDTIVQAGSHLILTQIG